jgi:hypothetical protein
LTLLSSFHSTSLLSCYSHRYCRCLSKWVGQKVVPCWSEKLLLIISSLETPHWVCLFTLFYSIPSLNNILFQVCVKKSLRVIHVIFCSYIAVVTSVPGLQIATSDDLINWKLLPGLFLEVGYN